MRRRGSSPAPFHAAILRPNLRLEPLHLEQVQSMSSVPAPREVSFLARLFTPDHARYEGVRPIHIYLLRTLYVLMFVGVGLPMWRDILGGRIPTDHVRAVAFCVWAAYPTLGLLGLRRPLQMLPLVLFMLFYKTLWLLAYAYPLWAAGRLGSAAPAEMAQVFRGVIFIYPLLPWGYIWRSFVAGPARKAG
jgi:hypothetical protein